MKRSFFAVLLLGSAMPAFAQESQDAPPSPVIFPQLELVDAAPVEAETPDAPQAAPALSPMGPDEAFERAQLAFATGDYQAALLFGDTAAAARNAEASTLVGLIHKDGLDDGQPDAYAAALAFRRAAEQEEPIALYELGLMAIAAQGGLAPVSARGYFSRAARAGHIPAMVEYAVILRESALPDDQEDALVWAERAALQGSSEGMYQYARLLDGWVHGPMDVTAALAWYQRAADEQHAEAAFEAALILAARDDLAAALPLMRLSAEAGYPPGEGQYGLWLYSGLAGEPDLAAASDWMRRGAEGGDAESQFLYAVVIGRGDGVESDYEEAYFWLLHAAHDSAGAPVGNADRDRFQAVLEGDLPPEVLARVRERYEATR